MSVQIRAATRRSLVRRTARQDRSARRSTTRSKNLRQNQTDAEEVIWHRLKAKRLLGLKFRRQFPIGPYFADFICIEKKLIIEIDGGQHCESATDKVRTDFLNKEGFEVIRFWNNDVLQNIEGAVSSLSLTLSRKRERESHME